MDKREVIKAIFDHEILGYKSSRLVRKNVLKDFEGRVKGLFKRSGAYTILLIDDSIALRMPGTIGLCTDYAITALLPLKIPLDEVLIELHKRQLPYHSTVITDANSETLILHAKTIPSKLEFVNSDHTIGYYLQNVYQCYDEITHKVLKSSFKIDTPLS